MLAMFGAAYARAGTPVLRLLLVGSVLRTVPLMAAAAARIDLAPRRIIALQACQALIVPTAAWVLMPGFRIAGAAIAWLIGQAITALVALMIGSLPRKGPS